MTNKKSIKESTEFLSEFQNEVHNALKFHGLMFPVSNEEINSFETIYGSTNVEMPSDLRDAKSIISWCEERIIETNSSPIGMAARNANNGLSEKTLETMKTLHEESTSKKKK